MKLLSEHPWLYGLVFTLVIKLVNGLAVWATAPESSEEWERLKVDAPRRAAAISLLRAWDINPRKIVSSVLTLWSGEVDRESLRIRSIKIKKGLDK